MKLIENLKAELVGKWLIHYAIYDCPACSSPFKANVADIKRKRKKNCGCRTEMPELPGEINGYKIISDLGTSTGRRMALIQCPHCINQYSVLVTLLRLNIARKHCGCYVKPVTRIAKVSEWDNIEYTRLQLTSIEVRSFKFTWNSMKQRCLNVKHPKYKHYGGRGITICDRWLTSLYNFIIDMGRKPTPAHSIDRINNNGNYEPSNCRWATAHEQQNNKRIRKQKVL